MRRLIHVVLLSVILSATSCVTPQPKKVDLGNLAGIIDGNETLYNNIIIEVQAVDGSVPPRATLDAFSELLDKYKICRKENVMVVYKQPVKFSAILWTREMVRTYEIVHRAIIDKNRNDRSFSVFVSYLSGIYAEPNMDNVVGLQYGWSSVAIFGFYSGRPAVTLLLHEFGHLIGVARNRKVEPVNPDRKQHCNDSGCVMFWRWNKRNGFCDECVADVKKLISRRNKVTGPL